MADKNLKEISNQLKISKNATNELLIKNINKIVEKIKSGKSKINPKPISKDKPNDFTCSELKKASGWVKYWSKQEKFNPNPIIKVKTKIKREGIDFELDSRVEKNKTVERNMQQTRNKFTFGSLTSDPLKPVPSKGSTTRGRPQNKINEESQQRFRDLFQQLKIKEDEERKIEEEIRKQIEEQLVLSKSSRDNSPNSRSSHTSGSSIGFKKALTFQQDFAARGYNKKYLPLQYHLSLESERKGLDDSGLWEQVAGYNEDLMTFPKYIAPEIDYDNIRSSRRLFEKIGWLVGTVEPNLMNKRKKPNENMPCRYGHLRDIRRFDDQSVKVLVKDDKRFLYPKEYTLKLLEQADYYKRKSFLEFKKVIYRKERKCDSKEYRAIKDWFDNERDDDFRTRYKNLKKITGYWGVNEVKMNEARDEKKEFEKPRDENGDAVVDWIFYHENEIEDFGALKQEYHNKMELFRDQHRTKGLVGAKVKFKVAYSLKIKPEAIEMHAIELKKSNEKTDNVVELL